MNELVKYDAACRAIADAKNIDEVKDIRDQAMAMRLYAKQAKNRQLEADAFEIRMRAERRVGEMMEVGRNDRSGHGGDRKSRGLENPLKPTLDEAGIDKNLAKRARKLAAIPEKEFERVITEGREATERGAERQVLKSVEIAAARGAYDDRKEKGATVETLEILARENRKFSVIYADPPWSFHTYSGKGKARSAERHYDTAPLSDIGALPIEPLAADDCALFLWAVMPELPGALEVIKAWGFEYTTAAFVWVKQNRGGEGVFTGMGYWTRANAEVCLLATRGSPMRLDMGVHQVVSSPVAEHSRKPEEVRTRIQRLLAGPYLELFGRRPVDGWTVWGNEVSSEAAE